MSNPVATSKLYETCTCLTDSDARVPHYLVNCNTRGTISHSGGINTSWQDLVCTKCHAHYEIKAKQSWQTKRENRWAQNSSLSSYSLNKRLYGGSYQRLQEQKKENIKHFLIIVDRNADVKEATKTIYCYKIDKAFPALKPKTFVKWKRYQDDSTLPLNTLVFCNNDNRLAWTSFGELSCEKINKELETFENGEIMNYKEYSDKVRDKFLNSDLIQRYFRGLTRKKVTTIIPEAASAIHPVGKPSEQSDAGEDTDEANGNGSNNLPQSVGPPPAQLRQLNFPGKKKICFRPGGKMSRPGSR